MSTFDFTQFKAVDKSNNKQPGSGLPTKVQEFSGLKYAKVTSKKTNKTIGKFTVSNDLFAAMGLNTNALRQFTAGSVAVLGVVENEKGKILKLTAKGDKGKSFKSDVLEADLTAVGLISGGEKQFLSLTKVADTTVIDGISCLAVYAIGKGSAKPKEAPAAANTAGAPVTAAAPVAESEAWN